MDEDDAAVEASRRRRRGQMAVAAGVLFAGTTLVSCQAGGWMLFFLEAQGRPVPYSHAYGPMNRALLGPAFLVAGAVGWGLARRFFLGDRDALGDLLTPDRTVQLALVTVVLVMAEAVSQRLGRTSHEITLLAVIAVLWLPSPGLNFLGKDEW